MGSRRHDQTALHDCARARPVSSARRPAARSIPSILLVVVVAAVSRESQQPTRRWAGCRLLRRRRRRRRLGRRTEGRIRPSSAVGARWRPSCSCGLQACPAGQPWHQFVGYWRRGSRSTLAAETSPGLASVSPLFFKQVAWASETRYRALLPYRVTSWAAVTSGVGCESHGKVRFRASASASAAWRRLVLYTGPSAGRGASASASVEGRRPEFVPRG